MLKTAAVVSQEEQLILSTLSPGRRRNGWLLPSCSDC